MEALEHEQNTFVTLTYDDENLPADGNLKTRDLTLFFKKLRKAIEPVKIRYYAVGEYGDESHRPHYHLALFGYPNCLRGNSSYTRYRSNCCENCDLIRDTWALGNVLLGDLTPHSAQYCAGYIIKKMATELVHTHRTPEFQRMSNRPGLGLKAMSAVANTLKKHDLHLKITDVPVVLRHGKKQFPLGTYLRKNLRELIGRDKKAPQAAHDQLAKEMLPMQQASKLSKEGKSTAKIQNEINKGAHARIDGKEKIYNQRKKL